MIFLTKRFEAAVRLLVGDGPVKQRLGLAYSRHLADLAPEDLPEGVRSVFVELEAAMRKVPPLGKESGVKLSVQKMSFVEASVHAERIFELYLDLLRGGDRSEPLKVIHNEDKPPRYLTAR
jgi:hypothetical protein